MLYVYTCLCARTCASYTEIDTPRLSVCMRVPVRACVFVCCVCLLHKVYLYVTEVCHHIFLRVLMFLRVCYVKIAKPRTKKAAAKAKTSGTSRVTPSTHVVFISMCFMSTRVCVCVRVHPILKSTRVVWLSVCHPVRACTCLCVCVLCIVYVYYIKCICT